MSSPERRGQFHPEQEPSSPYIKAARFSDDQISAQVYFQAQEILRANPCDLSSYRFKLDELSYVAVLGSPPPPALDQYMTTLLSSGEVTELPDDVVAYLQTRRQQASKVGKWVEGHYLGRADAKS